MLHFKKGFQQEFLQEIFQQLKKKMFASTASSNLVTLESQNF